MANERQPELFEDEPQTPIDYEARLLASFTPHAPVGNRTLFRGRIGQIRAATAAITTPGLHAVLYGDRGVGKTSLANILSDILGTAIDATARVVCNADDSFQSVVRRVLRQFYVRADKQSLGFTRVPQPDGYDLTRLVPEDFGPDDAAAALASTASLAVIVLDEFDRLPAAETVAIADLIKALSDRGAPATVMLVGVATDVTDLIASHESVTRCLRQILVPTMSHEEIAEIVDNGMASAGFAFQDSRARISIIESSQGYPHYTHLLCLNTGRAALDAGRTSITNEDLTNGTQAAVADVDQSLREAYYLAVTGTKKKNMWRAVVLACSIAQSDERGFFSSRAVQDSLGEILGRDVIQQSVAQHLGKLIEPGRGPLLRRIGPERRYRYNFVNPLMRPYVRLLGLSDAT